MACQKDENEKPTDVSNTRNLIAVLQQHAHWQSESHRIEGVEAIPAVVSSESFSFGTYTNGKGHFVWETLFADGGADYQEGDFQVDTLAREVHFSTTLQKTFTFRYALDTTEQLIRFSGTYNGEDTAITLSQK